MSDLRAKVRIIPPDLEVTNDETGLTVRGSDILNQMKGNNMWHNDRHGKYASAMYDGKVFKFRVGEEVTLPLAAAKHLRRMSAVCVGSDKLNGPLMPFLEISETYDAMAPVTVKVEYTPTTCPICHVEQSTYPALMRHQMAEHADLFKEKGEPKKKIEWDAPKKAEPVSDENNEAWEGQ